MNREHSGGSDPRRGTPTAERGRRNRGIVFSFALLCALALFLVSGLPQPLIAPALSQVLGLAGLGTAVVAAFWREPVFASHLTHWDKSAVLMGLSIVAGLISDPMLVEETLKNLSANVGSAESSGTGDAPKSSNSLGVGAEPTGHQSNWRDL
jgi:hypothetical protein